MDPEVLEGASALPFLTADHVASVNSILPTFGALIADGMFPIEPLSTKYIRIEISDGIIRALPVTPGARPSTIARGEKPSSIILEIPNVSHEDSVMADDIRDWLALAARSRDPEDTLAQKIEKRHGRNRLKFDMTREVMAFGALKGLIVDGAGNELYNLNDIFGVTQEVVFFDLGNSSTNVAAKVEEVVSTIEDNIVDETSTGIEARVSPEFFSAFIGHASFEKYYLGTPGARELLTQGRSQPAPGGGYRRRFDTQAGLVLIEDRQRYNKWDGTNTRMVADGEGWAYPAGTRDTHHTYVAPPIDMRELDGGVADGELIHMSTETMKHGMGEEWKYQMNALPVWARPNLVVKLDDDAS